MIIVRSPLRISLGGGGTDLASYYEKYKGFLIAGAITKYIYITITDPFRDDIILNYSERELVEDVRHIKHPIFRAVLSENEDLGRIEIHSIADIPSGTGLGSSSAFTAALLRAVHHQNAVEMTKTELAEETCRIEIEELGMPIGKQDQYASVFGGLNEFTFQTDGTVDVTPMKLSRSDIDLFCDHLLIYYTGKQRAAQDLLVDQNTKSKKNDQQMIDNLHRTKEIGYTSAEAIKNLDVEKYGALTAQHWENKVKRSNGMAPENVLDLHSKGIEAGAIGGKLVGAGGNGFLLFVVRNPNEFRLKMLSHGLRDVRFDFEAHGTQVIYDQR